MTSCFYEGKDLLAIVSYETSYSADDIVQLGNKLYEILLTVHDVHGRQTKYELREV